MAESQPIYLAGAFVSRSKRITVTYPYTDEPIATVAAADHNDFTEAIARAHETFELTRELPAYVRERVCRQIADGIENELELFAQTMTQELGKAIKDSRLEVARAIGVFRTSAEEAKRVGGELVDLDWNQGSEGRFGLVRRFPRGVIGAITPFNFPLNLVAHKIGPCLASGNTMVLKPASKTPLSALLLAKLIDQTEYPKGAISILPASAQEAQPLLTDPRVKLITFTGSAEIGWWIKENSGMKPVVLELGGNAGAIIADDADLEYATTRLLFGAFGVAGQSCISVQRIFVQENVIDTFLKLWAVKIAKLKVGDPMDSSTDIGVMVERKAVEQTMEYLARAEKNGARVLIGGKAGGNQIWPTVLTDVSPDMEVCTKELFAPVAVVTPYRQFEDAVAQVNNSEYGLQAGLFTNRMNDIIYAWKRIETGGVIVNDVPTYRVDQMPYGGVKRSGMGREGVRYAIEDMTEPKLLALNVRPSPPGAAPV